jgi:hypothetical protein
VDFFTVPTATFRVLYVFLVLAHERRRVLHFGVTEAPSAAWAAQQLTEAFPYAHPARYLLRDRDGLYGWEFVRRTQVLGLEEKRIAPRSPWQNPLVERLIGSIRRECLNCTIVLNEQHLRRRLTQYADYYHHHRPHRALAPDCPEPRAVEPPDQGKILELPLVGGLHHRYARQAAALTGQNLGSPRAWHIVPRIGMAFLAGCIPRGFLRPIAARVETFRSKPASP